MKYSRVYIDTIGYELPPVVVTTHELEARLRPVYQALHLPEGQLEALTGIVERRWWEPGYSPADGAVRAARKALELSHVLPEDVEALIYAAVCREHFEPATACHVASSLGIQPHTIFDLSNACLGVLNGIVELANRIELGQIKAGLVVSCETAREINDTMIDRMLQAVKGRGALLPNSPPMDLFKTSVATLTGGSGAVAVLVTDGSFVRNPRRRLLGGQTQAAPQFHALCRWGIEGMLSAARQFMSTDSVAILKYGVELGLRTWMAFLLRMGWASDMVDKVICHQVGAGHRDCILKALGISREKEYSTYEYLGNIGTVSLPLTAALAEEREFLRPGDRVGFLGIGSGLNCLMLGVEW
jgi:acyl-CoA:acyl-CoA alkyltransferase